MEITVLEIKKLTASSGHILTNGQSFGREVFLGLGDSVENWYEISDGEYESKMCALASPYAESTGGDGI